MVSHAVWKTWPSGLSNDKNLGFRPRFLSTESLGPCFTHGMGDHDQILQHFHFSPAPSRLTWTHWGLNGQLSVHFVNIITFYLLWSNVLPGLFQFFPIIIKFSINSRSNVQQAIGYIWPCLLTRIFVIKSQGAKMLSRLGLLQYQSHLSVCGQSGKGGQDQFVNNLGILYQINRMFWTNQSETHLSHYSDLRGLQLSQMKYVTDKICCL